MNTEPELLNERLERLAIVLDEIMPQCALLVRDALAILKEMEEERLEWIGTVAICPAEKKHLTASILTSIMLYR